ncbi:hypothetical protein [Synechococcus sp. MIT S1220]|uniref:hypothetical protein n=1 Tax=Synechococcus sp. MIT S1220 TaxID=3082549 RepID=UPI0039AF72D5
MVSSRNSSARPGRDPREAGISACLQAPMVVSNKVVDEDEQRRSNKVFVLNQNQV